MGNVCNPCPLKLIYFIREVRAIYLQVFALQWARKLLLLWWGSKVSKEISLANEQSLGKIPSMPKYRMLMAILFLQKNKSNIYCENCFIPGTDQRIYSYSENFIAIGVCKHGYRGVICAECIEGFGAAQIISDVLTALINLIILNKRFYSLSNWFSSFQETGFP